MKKIPNYMFYLFLHSYIYSWFQSSKVQLFLYFWQSAIFIRKCLLPTTYDGCHHHYASIFLSELVFLQLFCQLKKASSLIFLLFSYTDITSERSFSIKLISKWAELSSGLFWQSIFTSNLAAEFKPCPRTVRSAM